MRHPFAMILSALLILFSNGPFHIEKMKIGRRGYWDCEYQLMKYKGTNKLLQLAAQQTTSHVQNDLDEYLSTCKEVGKSDPKPDTAWDFSSSIDVALARPTLVSTEVETSSFTGGAHPITYTAQLVFGVIHGKPVRLKLKDLFKTNEDSRKVISELVVPILRKKGASSTLDPSFKELSADLVEKFLVLPGGLRFDFSSYDVGAYVEGPYTATVPYSKLRSHLNSRGPLNYLFH